ncbi:glycosyltransferase family 69 protein [Amanita muscaria Koide BX008]|uniref:Glycosyltransferase family 69 protein n=1 Tax=Amanita muscaria (strain Koide BX008) TaxID=946122 RepID=A0A0C2TI51_AMAMK|nr:glycosyltransferase family 69 protein [Amanita muscaria Koide BX008]
MTSFTRKIPTPIALAIGILFGVLFAKLVSWTTEDSMPMWRTRSLATKSHQQSRHPIQPPSLEKRRRVLDLLTSLSSHYTKECTRISNLQPLYPQQAVDRYAPLVGHKATPGQSWFSKLFFGTNDQVPLGEGRKEYPPSDHKYYFAINLYNSFDVIPDLFATLFRVAAILGYQNVFVSIYENGSTDQTKALLRIYDALTKSVGMRVSIKTSMRRRGAFNHRIEYLAEVRNAAFWPLHDLRDSENEYFETIVFMNDVLPCVDDLLELIWQSRRNNAGITCAADYMFHPDISAPVFYDNWVARDINGTALENAPFEKVFHHRNSGYRFQRHLPVQVQSCWNGIAVLDSQPFYSPPQVRFRMARIAEGECSASECSLICNDYWEAGYGRILMVPRVKLAYDNKVYDIIHPKRRNLTAIRGFARLGGLPDDPRTDPQDRAWFGPHDRLFTEEESEPLDFDAGPDHVWCWGWDGAGDLDGPDVDPIWERMPNRSTLANAVAVRHDRSLPLL